MIKYAKFEFAAGDKHVVFNCPQDITTVAPRVTKGRTIGGFSNYVKALKAHVQAQGLSDEFIFMLTPAEYKKHRGEMLAATGKVIVLDNTSITLCKDSEALAEIKNLSDKNQFLIRDYKTSFSSSETYLTSVKNQMSGLLWESNDRKTVLLDFKCGAEEAMEAYAAKKEQVTAKATAPALNEQCFVINEQDPSFKKIMGKVKATVKFVSSQDDVESDSYFELGGCNMIQGADLYNIVPRLYFSTYPDETSWDFENEGEWLVKKGQCEGMAADTYWYLTFEACKVES